MKIKYQQIVNPFGKSYVQWRTGKPFINNPRAMLIHRVKYAGTHTCYDGSTHNSAHLWCGNQFVGRGCRDEAFIEMPGKDRLLCSRCEALAVAAGELSASKIAGRHVHLGVMVPKRVCCNGHDN